MSHLLELSGKVALVTGAQRGIGAAIARIFADAGATVVINHIVEDEQAQALAKELSRGGGRASCAKFDVTDSTAVATGFEQILERHQRLDIVVNNAGIRRDTLALRMKDEEWRDTMRVNLDGTFYCCRAAAAVMRKSGGSVVNMSSVAAFTGSVGQANYAAAKAGIVGLTRSLAMEYAGRGIRFNCVVPGLIDTEMTQSLGENVKQQYLARIPLGRFGEPAEVAAAVLFLASDAASYITGTTIHVNGGGYPA
jgi:3-oxoacyl-[acyl-carrier protein] reductase